MEGPSTTMETTPHPYVLIADDDLSYVRSFQNGLTAAGTPVVLASTGSEATAFAKAIPNLYLAFVDSRIPPTGGLALMEQLHQIEPGLTVIVTAMSGSASAAVEAIKRGAEDYILKPFDLTELVEKVGRFRDLFQHNRDAKTEESVTVHASMLEDFICRSQAMGAVLDEAKRVAPLEVSVLLVGERAVGKEMLALAIHAASPRGQRPFFRIDCPTIAHELPGRDPLIPSLSAPEVSEAALQRMLSVTAGGTLFLNEIGALPQEAVNKLARILNGNWRPEGGSTVSAGPGPRIIASTSASLAELQRGSFPRELYACVAGVVIEIPPLRDRPEDVPALAEYFLNRLEQRYDQQFVLGWTALSLLMDYPLPGNVRELQYVLERAAIHLLRVPRKVTDRCIRQFLEDSRIPCDRDTLAEQPMDLKYVEHQAIERAIFLAKGNRKQAAALLGINRSTLH